MAFRSLRTATRIISSAHPDWHPPRLVRNILPHKTWAKEAVRFLWHSANYEYLLSASISDARLRKYAALVRHVVYKCRTGKHNPPKFWGLGPGFLTTRSLPGLPGLTSVECESTSLANRTVEELLYVFVPTLRQLVVQDQAADGLNGDLGSYSQRQLEGVSWFDTMVRNCPRLPSIALGTDLHIDTATFEKFLDHAVHLKSVTLGTENEHLLVDALAPVEITISYHSYENNADILGRLTKMHALEHLELAVWDVWLTSSDISNFKTLTKLKSLKVFSNEGQARIGCSATAEELAEMIEAMLFLDEFR